MNPLNMSDYSEALKKDKKTDAAFQKFKICRDRHLNMLTVKSALSPEQKTAFPKPKEW